MATFKAKLTFEELETRDNPSDTPIPTPNQNPYQFQNFNAPPEITSFTVTPIGPGQYSIVGTIVDDDPVGGRTVKVTFPNGAVFNVPVIPTQGDPTDGSFAVVVTYNGPAGLAQAVYTDVTNQSDDAFAPVP